MKRKKVLGTVAAIVLLGGGLCASCGNGKTAGTWSADEQQLIGTNQDDTAMRLWVVDNESDSLFLRRQCRQLTKDDVESPYFDRLKRRMLLTVTNPDNEGVGIAAPQVGIGRRLIAVQRLDKEGEPFEFYINPRLIHLSDQKRTGWEGCLSIPGERGKVERSSMVVLEHNDEASFALRTDTIRGFTAVIFQHEADHLDGLLYTDKADTIVMQQSPNKQ